LARDLRRSKIPCELLSHPFPDLQELQLTKRRDRRPRTAPIPATVAVPPMVALDVVALLVVALCGALAWASRGNLNVDGAAYLDLAGRLAGGDLAGFVQGYWSPMYPALLGVLLAVTGASGNLAITLAHALNLCIAIAGIVLLWREARRHRGVTWGVLSLTAFMLASARTVRIDAVTPDLLLLVVVIGLGLELLRADGWRAANVGIWAGVAFLVKTSIWPWLLVAAGVGIVVLRRQPVRRRQLQFAVAVSAVPLLLWSAVVSVHEGRPTLGSSGRLNACWYLLSCDGRTPDSHGGAHREYHDWLLGAETQAKVATFTAVGWTYAPWSDPSGWQRGVLTQEQYRPSMADFIVYVSKQLGLVIGLWMGFLIALVLLPTLFTTRRAPRWRDVARSPAGLLMVLGGLGILQFVAVHAEPRLIAPFVMLFALGWITWRLAGSTRQGNWAVAVVGVIGALAIGVWHLRDQSLVTASSVARTEQLEKTHLPMLAPHRVAVVGPALPMMPDLYRARAMVVAQVIEPDPETLTTWSPTAQAALTARLRGLGATAIWLSRGRDAFRIIPLEAASSP
jgi:hypothetical protein